MNEFGDRAPARTEASTRRIGAGMVALAWVLGLVMLTVIFGKLITQQWNPNQSVASTTGEDGRAEVSLQRNRDGHYVVSGSINGVAVVFLLDTGATNVSVPAGLAERIGLRVGPARRTQTANGLITTYATSLASVAVGEIELHDVRAQINPMVQGGEVLLGMSFLKQLDLQQSGSKLTLKEPRPGE